MILVAFLTYSVTLVLEQKLIESTEISAVLGFEGAFSCVSLLVIVPLGTFVPCLYYFADKCTLSGLHYYFIRLDAFLPELFTDCKF